MAAAEVEGSGPPDPDELRDYLVASFDLYLPEKGRRLLRRILATRIHLTVRVEGREVGTGLFRGVDVDTRDLLEHLDG